MSAALKAAFEEFAGVAAPVLHIQDEAYYQAALALVSEFMAEAEDSEHEPLNPMIMLLAKAIEDYESHDPELAAFAAEANRIPPDVAMLHLLMDQHGLGVADFPEIGDKSLVSRILNGQRNLTKNHIMKLSKRFGIKPGLFFD